MLKKNIAVIGSGSWGVALAMLLNKNGHNVKLWSYNPAEAEMINSQRKCKFLPDVILPKGIVCYTSLEESMSDVELVLIVTPSSAIRETLNKLKPFAKESHTFILCSKGMEADTQKVYTEVIKEVLPFVNVAALSGPSHAEEVF